MVKDAKTIDNNIHKFDEQAQRKLPDPPVLMTASAYRDNTDIKLILKTEIVRIIQIKKPLKV